MPRPGSFLRVCLRIFRGRDPSLAEFDVPVVTPTIAIYEDLTDALGFPVFHVRKQIHEAADLLIRSPVIREDPGSLLPYLVTNPDDWGERFERFSSEDGINFVEELVADFYRNISAIERDTARELKQAERDNKNVTLPPKPGKPFRMQLAQMPPDRYYTLRNVMSYRDSSRYFVLSALGNRYDKWLEDTS